MNRVNGEKHKVGVSISGQDVAAWVTRSTAFRVFTVIVLMVAAKRLDWGWAWVYTALILAFDVATAAVTLPRLAGRVGVDGLAKESTKGWDRVIMPLAAGVLPLASLIVAGLDVRWGWRPNIPAVVQAGAVVLSALGYGVFVWAIAFNRSFDATVHVQDEHQMATSGPYRFVRHPGYGGAVLYSVGVPLMLGSVWATLIGGLAALMFVVRTALEDATLMDELDGYRAFADETPFRLLPGIW